MKESENSKSILSETRRLMKQYNIIGTPKKENLSGRWNLFNVLYA